MMRLQTLFIGLIAALSPACAQATETPRTWAGVWRGSVGSMPVYACLQDDSVGHVGAYYYLKHLRIITLRHAPADKSRSDIAVLTETPTLSGKSKGPYWTNMMVKGNRMTATWTGAGKTLSIVLRRVPQVMANTDPCADLAFNKPRATPVRISKQRGSIDGIGYTILSADVGRQFDWVSIASFQLDGTTPAIRKINSKLRHYIPGAPETSEYLDCTGTNIASNGSDGQYEVETKPALLTAHWAVVKTNYADTCGGAHPNYVVGWTNWNLQSGEGFDLLTWLGPDAVKVTPLHSYSMAEILPPLKNLLIKGWPRNDEECAGIAEDVADWNARLTRNGLAFTPSLPHAALACSDDVNLPFDQIVPLLNAAGKAGIASFRADLEAQGER